ncbi:MAG TPA: VOC family protein [Pyrinomonadaceae bacterium]|jgi:predicted enzyme related to lactoylglutathione lyase
MVKFNGYIWAGLFVYDFEKEIAFYRDQVGLPFLRQGNEYAFFDAGNGDLFELWPNGVLSKPAKTPAQQSLRVSFHVDNLKDAVAELTKRGVTFVGGGDEDGTQWAIFVDPEGNLLEMKQLTPTPAPKPKPTPKPTRAR